jgi:hypothetical protein
MSFKMMIVMMMILIEIVPTKGNVVNGFLVSDERNKQVVTMGIKIIKNKACWSNEYIK